MVPRNPKSCCPSLGTSRAVKPAAYSYIEPDTRSRLSRLTLQTSISMPAYTHSSISCPSMKLHTRPSSSTNPPCPISTAVSSAQSSPILSRATTHSSLSQDIPHSVRCWRSDEALLRSPSIQQEHQQRTSSTRSPAVSSSQSSGFFKRKPAHRSSTGVDHYGRHGDQWLFGDISLRETARGLMRRADSRSSLQVVASGRCGPCSAAQTLP